MNVKFKTGKGELSLVVDGKYVARLLRYADSQFWQLTDVRLAPNVTPHGFSFVSAEDYWSEYVCRSTDEFKFVTQRLQNYFCSDTNIIHYCTFSGIVYSENRPKCFEKAFDQGGYFTFDDGKRELLALNRFWRTATDLNVKIENPRLQPTVTQLRFDYRKHCDELGQNEIPEKETVFLWRPFTEKLPDGVVSDLKALNEINDNAQYVAFTWDNEDNELYPNIAKYVAERHNEYFFLIDTHTGAAE